MATAESVVLVPPERVYNLPIFETFLILDTRTVEDRQKGWIVSSVSVPAPVERNPSLEVRRASVLESLSGADEESRAHAAWLANTLVTVGAGSLVPANPQERADDDEDDRGSSGGYTGAGEGDDEAAAVAGYVKSFVQRLQRDLREVWVIEGGYEAFSETYPFLCGHLSVADMVPLPFHMGRGLFLGSRAFCLSPSTAASLGLTHAILHVDAKEAASDMLEDLPISVLWCGVEDKNAADMFATWEACCLFIDEALEGGGTVLVQLHGRSRSASVIMAWRMWKHGHSLAEARAFLDAKCNVVDHRFAFSDQLANWSRGAIAGGTDEGAANCDTTMSEATAGVSEVDAPPDSGDVAMSDVQ